MGLNYDIDETNTFFMKHYNDSGEYRNALKDLNLRERARNSNLDSAYKSTTPFLKK